MDVCKTRWDELRVHVLNYMRTSCADDIVYKNEDTYIRTYVVYVLLFRDSKVVAHTLGIRQFSPKWCEKDPGRSITLRR